VTRNAIPNWRCFEDRPAPLLQRVFAKRPLVVLIGAPAQIVSAPAAIFNDARPKNGEAGIIKREAVAIPDIYVPIKRRGTLDQMRVDEIATSMLDKGQLAPILVRADGPRFVLVEGLHRLEAAKAR